MSDWMGGLISGAGSLLGGGLGAIGTAYGAQKAYDAQMKTNEMQINLANTAHQREVADLRKAGLNPLLSGTGGQGASTPTLRAPTQLGEGMQHASQQMGNAMQNTANAVMQWMTGQQQIELQKANAEAARAQADKAAADAARTRKDTGWIDPLNNLTINEGNQRITESTQRTLESSARTATTEALREPQVRKLVAEAAHISQQNKTEEQKTKEATEAANNAKQLYGARASEAATIAAQLATNYKEYYLKEKNLAIDEKQLQVEILREHKTSAIIRAILDNEYGRALEWSKIMSNPTSAAMYGLGSLASNKPNPAGSHVLPQRR